MIGRKKKKKKKKKKVITVEHLKCLKYIPDRIFEIELSNKSMFIGISHWINLVYLGKMLELWVTYSINYSWK